MLYRWNVLCVCALSLSRRYLPPTIRLSAIHTFFILNTNRENVFVLFNKYINSANIWIVCVCRFWVEECLLATATTRSESSQCPWHGRRCCHDVVAVVQNPFGKIPFFIRFCHLDQMFVGSIDKSVLYFVSLFNSSNFFFLMLLNNNSAWFKRWKFSYFTTAAIIR